MTDERAAFARRSWEHLRATRALAAEQLPGSLTDDLLVPAADVARHARRWGSDAGLPDRLVDGNLGAALAGVVIARQHDHPGVDAASLLARILEDVDRYAAAAIEVLRCDHPDGSSVYYRRRNCCLRDRIDGMDLHRCDTCSLRNPADLDTMVRKTIERRRPQTPGS